MSDLINEQKHHYELYECNIIAIDEDIYVEWNKMRRILEYIGIYNEYLTKWDTKIRLNNYES